MTDNTAVATQDEIKEPRVIDTFRANLDKAAAVIMPLLPAHVTAEKFKSMVITTIAYNPKLQECTPTSLLRATADAAELGLSLNPNMKECDILPVWSKDGTVAQCRPRYTGLMKLARQGGVITSIYAHEVYERDHFVYEYGLNKRLEHKPADGDRGELTFAYVVWKTRDGEAEFEVVDKKAVEKSKASSESYKAFKAGKLKAEFCTWVQHESEMWRKTAVRRGSKYMPQTTENEAFRKALALETDVRFDDDTPLLPPSDAPAVLAPPRPTRQPDARAEAETARKDEYERGRQYRQTMAEDAAADDAEHVEAHIAATTGATLGNVDAVLSEIRAKIAGVKGRQMLGAIEKDYEPEMLDLPEAAREIIRAEIETRRGELKK